MPNIAGSFNRGQRLGGGGGQSIPALLSFIIQMERFAETKKQNVFSRNLARERETRMGEIFEFQKEQTVLAGERREEAKGAAKTEKVAKVKAATAKQIKDRKFTLLSSKTRNLIREREAALESEEKFAVLGIDGRFTGEMRKVNWPGIGNRKANLLKKNRKFGISEYEIDFEDPTINFDLSLTEIQERQATPLQGPTQTGVTLDTLRTPTDTSFQNLTLDELLQKFQP